MVTTLPRYCPLVISYLCQWQWNVWGTICIFSHCPGCAQESNGCWCYWGRISEKMSNEESAIPPILQQNPSTFLILPIATKNNCIKLTPNVSTTFFMLKMKKWILVPSFSRSVRPPKRGWWVKNWEFWFDFFFYLNIRYHSFDQ